MFAELWPSETAGDGRVRAPYLKREDGQGGARLRRRVGCRHCGFPGADLDRHDSSGGSLAGNGAGGSVTEQSNGDGDQAYNSGGGCPMCFSKNYAGSKRRDELLHSNSSHNRLA